MDTEPEWSCPICREISAEIAYVGSCLHEFCRTCILRWARKNPSCPLCRQVVHTIIYPTTPSLQILELVFPEPPVYDGVMLDEMPDDAESHLYVAGFTPDTWAFFFRNYTEILQPLELWLNEVLCGSTWWDVAFTHGTVVASLCRYGLHEEALTRELRPLLREQSRAFVRHLIDVAAERCCELVLRSLELAVMPSAELDELPSLAVNAEQEEPREQAEPAGAEASGNGQLGEGSAPGPSGNPARRRSGGSEGFLEA